MTTQWVNHALVQPVLRNQKPAPLLGTPKAVLPGAQSPPRLGAQAGLGEGPGLPG